MFCISHTADAFTIKGDCASCSAYNRSPFHAPLNKGICLSDVVATCPCHSHLRKRKKQRKFVCGFIGAFKLGLPV